MTTQETKNIHITLVAQPHGTVTWKTKEIVEYYDGMK